MFEKWYAPSADSSVTMSAANTTADCVTREPYPRREPYPPCLTLTNRR